MKTIMKLLLPMLAVLSFLPTGCKREDWGILNQGKHEIPAFLTDAEVPMAWFRLAVTLVRTTPGNTGPVAARTFGYMGLALYESVVPGMPEYKSIQSQLNGLPTLPKAEHDKDLLGAISANAALASMVHHMFGNASASQNNTIDSLENVFNTEFKTDLADNVLGQAMARSFDQSVQFGRDIADAIYNWSLTDGGDKAYANIFPPDYMPPVGPGLWVPLPGQAAQNSHWGNNRTFIAGNATSTQPGLPPAYSTDPSSQLYKEESEVYNESINQDPVHRAIALYWAAIPPPTVSISILGSVLTDKNSSLSTAALAYCKLGIAIADAFVSCYKTKYIYNQLRPITYIRANFSSTWSPLIGTPPFPDYTSAHSVQTGAAARVLADIFGDNTSFTDYSINDLGFTPRSFNKFSDYANEVGLSRIYGGIHIRSSDFVGLDQGNKVGMHISALHFKK
jgi:hypothetical protein